MSHSVADPTDSSVRHRNSHLTSQDREVKAASSLDFPTPDTVRRHSGELVESDVGPSNPVRAESAEISKGPAHASDQKSTRSGISRYTTELKLAKNREAQRKFRVNKKAHAGDMQTQLAKAIAQVRALEESKYWLQASNVLLRNSSLVHFNEGGQAEPTQADAVTRHTTSPGAASGQGSSQDAPKAQLSAAWTDHVHQMGNCLLQMDGNEEPSVHLKLQRLTTEAMTLIAQLARLHGKLSGPVVYNAEPSGTDEHLYPPADEAFHARILANLELSSAQIEDLLFLRRLFLTRRCVLSVERKNLTRQLAVSDHDVLNPSENMPAVNHLTDRLKDNAAEEHELFYKVARAMFRGVLTIKQVAKVMLHAYPYVNIQESLLDTIAMLCKAPSKEAIVADAQTDCMEVDYVQLLQYCKAVGATVYSGYLPLSTCCSDAGHGSG